MNKIVKPFKYNSAIQVNASKSYAQRALILSAISLGESHLKNIDDSADVLAVLNCIKELGAEIKQVAPKEFKVIPAKWELKEKLILNVGESGLALHLLAFIATQFCKDFEVIGTGTLLKRSQKKLIDLLEFCGLNVSHTNFHLPLRIHGILNPSNVVFDASESSQEVSGMLMTFPLLNNPSSLKIISPVSQPYIEMSLDIMAHFGIQLEKKNAVFYFPGKQHYTGNTYEIEGDWSGSATHIVGAVISGKLQLSGLNPTSKQADRAILEVVKSAGCEFYFIDSILHLNKKQKIIPFSFDITDCPDLFPVLAILACAANGCSKISGIHRLLNKESNRLTSVQEMLLRFDVESSVENDTIFIHGTGKVKTTEISSYNDHRIVMAAAIAATISDGPISIQNAHAIQKSYPTFFEVLLA
jgi:3-phosphoshikimate 1-carboxyvinyltransferase